MGRTAQVPATRFVAKVRLAESGCLEWTASINSGGYGTFYAGGGAVELAHRWAYQHFIGEIPDGMQIDHLCRNRKCVNPHHLEPVTLWENHIRANAISVQNAAKTTCPAGHPYEGANLYLDRRGQRRCRQCMRRNDAARRSQTTTGKA